MFMHIIILWYFYFLIFVIVFVSCNYLIISENKLFHHKPSLILGNCPFIHEIKSTY